MRDLSGAGRANDLFNTILRNAKLLAGAEEMYEDRPSFEPPEQHGVFIDKGPYYKKKALFLGPKTELDKRVKRGDHLVEMPKLDKASYKHDKAYSDIKKMNLPKKEHLQEIHEADKDFIKEVVGDKETPKTSAIAAKMIALKMLAEDKFGLSPSVFSGFGKEYEDIERRVCYPCMLIRQERKDGNQKGGFLGTLATVILSTLAPIAVRKLSKLIKGSGKDKVKDVSMELAKLDKPRQIEALSRVINHMGESAFE